MSSSREDLKNVEYWLGQVDRDDRRPTKAEMGMIRDYKEQRGNLRRKVNGI